MSVDRRTLHLSVLLVTGLILSTSFIAVSSGPAPPSQSASPAQNMRIVKEYGKLPLSFEANTGQADPEAKFLARSDGHGLYLTAKGAVLMLCHTPHSQRERSPAQRPVVCDELQMQLAGASTKTKPRGEEQLPGTVNYFMGNDPAKWRTNIPTYAKVRYASPYPGIDLVYYGNQQQLEFDFVLAPKTDPRLIRLRFGWTNDLHLAANGDLQVTTTDGALAFHKPLAYQTVDGHRRAVAGDFVLLGKHTVGFRLGGYDRSKTLVIDPALAYSTFLGGAGNDSAKAIAVDSAGNAYVAGYAISTDFPVTPGAFQTTNHAAGNQETNAFVAKLNPTGTALFYSTYLGGSGGDMGNGIAVDSAGNAYVTGQTLSTDFPVTPGAYQTTNKGAANGVINLFVTKLDPTGTALVYSTYLGGSGLSSDGPFYGDRGTAIAVDEAGNVCLTGGAYSADFPVTQGAFQTTNHGTATSDANAFVTKLNSTGTALVYSTYLGGSGGNRVGIGFGDIANAIAVDAAGDAYVTGQAGSSDFPVTTGAFQSTNKAVANQGTNAFVSKLNPTGTGMVYSTYLGGSVADIGNAIAIDSAGDVYVAGQAGSADFPVTSGAFQTTNLSKISSTNAFITKLNPSSTALVYSTYLGGSGGAVNASPTLAFAAGDQANGLALDSSGNVYVAGSTASADFPVTSGAYQSVNNDQPGCVGGCIGGYNAFFIELSSTGSALLYSTYLGGNGINPNQNVGVTEFGNGDQANALALDSSGNVYVAGQAVSYDFPVTSGSFQATNPSAHSTLPGSGSPFVAKFNVSGTSNTTAPTVKVTPASSTITSALPLTVTVSVSGGSGNPVPTGTVTLASGTYSSAATTLSGGTATIDIPAGSLVPDEAVACGYAASPDILSANYVPDAASSSTYKFSSGLGSVDVVAPCISVTPDVTTISLTQAQSQPFSVTIAATGGPGNPVPTGTVTLTTGSYTSAATTLSAGGATITIPAGTLIAGENLLNISYSGDNNYAPFPLASLAIVNVTTGSGTPSFTIIGTPVTVNAGATTGNISTITVTSTAGFKGSVNLTAAVTSGPTGAQYPPTFSFVPSSQVIVGLNPGTATLIITTTAPGSCTQASRAPFGGPRYAGEAALACILLFGIPASRRRWRIVLGMLPLLIIVTIGLLACGGGNSTRSCNGTTPGTYTVTVTGTSGPTSATGTVTLTVR